MEGRNRQPVALFALQHLAHPLFHLSGGLVGKGHCSNFACAHATLLHEVGNLGGDHAGFARPRTRQYQAGAIDIAHRFLLAWVEPFDTAKNALWRLGRHGEG